jgi:hypothetical protein
MKTSWICLAALLATSSAACKKKAGEPTCEQVVPALVKQMGDKLADQAAKDDFKKSLFALPSACKTDKWSDSTIACVVDAEDARAECKDKFTDAQWQKVGVIVGAAMSKAGIDG